MEINDYIAHMKAFYSSFLKYIESDSDTSEDFQEFVEFINNNQYRANPDEFRSLIHIINKVSNHHKHNSVFDSKIRQILLHFSDQIKQTFSNSDIFRIFKNNKFILSFLFDSKILIANEEISKLLLSKYHRERCNFFYPEIKPFSAENATNMSLRYLDSSITDDPNFHKKRQEGVNDSYVCQLIRQDSLDEFRTFLKEQKLDCNDFIPDSVFETNLFLEKNESNFFDYAAFYDSKRIFEFLKNEISLQSMLWNYAIFGQNKELIDLLKENKIESRDSPSTCFINSMKCHHNEIAKTFTIDENDSSFKKHVLCFYNFEFFPNEFKEDDYQLIFDLACRYDYVSIVKILLQTGKIQLQEILKKNHKITYFF